MPRAARHPPSPPRRREAQADAASEPLLSSFLYASILSHDSFERSLAFVLSNRLSDATFLSTELFEVFYSILRSKPDINQAALADIAAVRERVRGRQRGAGAAGRPSCGALPLAVLPPPAGGAQTGACAPPATRPPLPPRPPRRTRPACRTARPCCTSRASTPSRWVPRSAERRGAVANRGYAALAAGWCARHRARHHHTPSTHPACGSQPGPLPHQPDSTMPLPCLPRRPLPRRTPPHPPPPQAHRIAHELWSRGRRVMAVALQSRMSEVFAVDIHPAARFGKGILLDHGTGVVIGETAELGDNVSILQNVTLGGGLRVGVCACVRGWVAVCVVAGGVGVEVQAAGRQRVVGRGRGGVGGGWQAEVQPVGARQARMRRVWAAA